MNTVYHWIRVQERDVNSAPRIDCVPECTGPGAHVHEYRAPNIRPTSAETAKLRALDAVKE